MTVLVLACACPACVCVCGGVWGGGHATWTPEGCPCCTPAAPCACVCCFAINATLSPHPLAPPPTLTGGAGPVLHHLRGRQPAAPHPQLSRHEVPARHFEGGLCGMQSFWQGRGGAAA